MDAVGAANIVIDTNLLAVGGAKFVVGDLGPGWFTVGKLGRGDTIAIVFPNRVAILTAEEAAGQVR